MISISSLLNILQKKKKPSGHYRLELKWGSSPLWFKGPQDDIFHQADVEKAPVSLDLESAIIRWNKIFQSCSNRNESNSYGLSDPEADELFRKAIDTQGEALYYRMRYELFGKHDASYVAWFFEEKTIP